MAVFNVMKGRVFMKEIKINHHGRTVYGKAYLPKDRGAHPLVIFSHGYNGCMDDFAVSAEYFCRQGYAAVCFTFCGGSTQDKSAFHTYDMTIFTEVEDLKAVISEAASWTEIDPKRIFLFGGSMGGLVSALVASELQTEIQGLALLYPALCVADDWTKRYPEVDQIPERIKFWGMTLGRDYAATVHNFDVYEQLQKYQGSVLIMHGTEDEIVPITYSEKAASIYEQVRFYRFAGEGHGFSEAGNRRMEAMVLTFVQDACEK